MERIVEYFARQQFRRFDRRGGPSRFDRLVARAPMLVPAVFVGAVVVLWASRRQPLLIGVAVAAILVLAPQAMGTRLAVTRWDRDRP